MVSGMVKDTIPAMAIPEVPAHYLTGPKEALLNRGMENMEND